MNIKQICSQASATTERFERELLLTHALNQPRAYLYSHPEKELSQTEFELFNQLLQRREQGEPIAYILGETEFYSLKFYITPAVLIPRPETELLIDYVLENFKQKKLCMWELGTGSGIISVTLARHRPDWDITATDISEEALDVAKKNAHFHKAHNIKFIKSNWYEGLDSAKADLIISNPPYVAENDTHLNELRFEPSLALISGKEGMDAIKTIIQEAKTHLKSNGWVLLEHGYDQAKWVQNSFRENQFSEIKTMDDLNHHPRMTIAKNV
ncbi:MAG TPA: peptide chain release factor N(5)-glutamine methyltransferase [Gammaproteobacteria bacterium]|nr:peptide chain release factor N(5)-glutamine methyltransferase [Gammaproteobacteria bacterium]